jgi:hypothetical protein
MVLGCLASGATGAAFVTPLANRRAAPLVFDGDVRGLADAPATAVLFDGDVRGLVDARATAAARLGDCMTSCFWAARRVGAGAG